MRKVALTAAILCLWLVAMAAPLAAQEGKKGEPAMSDSMAAMMAEWAKYATPGPEHANLAKMNGKWTYVSKMTMDPSQPPMESKGTAEQKPVMGGRYFIGEYKGDMMGQPYEGMGIYGYDIYKKQYFGTWIDNMSTMIMMMTGAGKADGSEITYTGSYEDPMTKTTKGMREVCKWTGPDSYVMEFYDLVPGQPERKTMEITVTRAK